MVMRERKNDDCSSIQLWHLSNNESRSNIIARKDLMIMRERGGLEKRDLVYPPRWLFLLANPRLGL